MIVVFVRIHNHLHSPPSTQRISLSSGDLPSLRQSLFDTYGVPTTSQRLFFDEAQKRPVTTATSLAHGQLLHLFQQNDETEYTQQRPLTGFTRGNSDTTSSDALLAEQLQRETRQHDLRGAQRGSVESEIPFYYGAVPETEVIQDENRETVLHRVLIFAWGLRILSVLDAILLFCTILLRAPSQERTILAALVGGPVIGFVAISQFVPILLVAYLIYHMSCMIAAIWFGIFLRRNYWEIPGTVFHGWLSNLVIRFICLIQRNSRETQSTVRRRFFDWPILLMPRQHRRHQRVMQLV